MDVYVAMKPLQSLLKFPFTFPQTRLGAFHQINIPEVQLISLLIITVKLIFPFDDITRHAYSSQDPAAYSVNWLSWKHAQETQETGDRTRKLGPDMAIQVREEDVFEMSKDQLDDYMDWYEKMFVQDKGEIEIMFVVYQGTCSANLDRSHGDPSRRRHIPSRQDWLADTS